MALPMNLKKRIESASWAAPAFRLPRWRLESQKENWKFLLELDQADYLSDKESQKENWKSPSRLSFFSGSRGYESQKENWKLKKKVKDTIKFSKRRISKRELKVQFLLTFTTLLSFIWISKRELKGSLLSLEAPAAFVVESQKENWKFQIMGMASFRSSILNLKKRIESKQPTVPYPIYLKHRISKRELKATRSALSIQDNSFCSNLKKRIESPRPFLRLPAASSRWNLKKRIES